MIVIKIHAGPGNQLFQYAFGLALARNHKTQLHLDASYVNYYPTSNQIPNQRFHLDRFSLVDSKILDSPLLKWGHSIMPNKMIKKIYITNLNHKLRRMSLLRIRDDPKLGQAHFFDLPDNCYLDGYFQYPAIFHHLSDELISNLTYPHPQVAKGDLDLIRQSSSPVAINLRRKEYLHPNNLKNQGICEVEYYQKAITYINNRVPDPTYFVFSDDIRDSKRFLSSLDVRMQFLNDNANKDIFSDMFLMQQCHHLILANSSYSWWTAFLNKNDNKIVIAPAQWVVNKSWQSFNNTITLKTWIRI